MSGNEVRLINDLSAAIASGQALPDEVAKAVGAEPPAHDAPIRSSDPGANIEIVKVPSGNQVWSVIVTFDAPLPLAMIESAFGSSSPLPRSHPRGDHRVRFDASKNAITLIADIGTGDLMKAVTVQADRAEV